MAVAQSCVCRLAPEVLVEWMSVNDLCVSLHYPMRQNSFRLPSFHAVLDARCGHVAVADPGPSTVSCPGMTVHAYDTLGRSSLLACRRLWNGAGVLVCLENP